MSLDVNECQIMHNTASNGPVWPDLVNGDQVRSRIWGTNDLVLIEAELRNLGQVMAGMSLWGKIAQIWPKVAYNDLLYVLMSRYDKFWPYLCLYYQFWPIWHIRSCLIIFWWKCQVIAKMAKNDLYWYYMSCCSKVCPFMTTFYIA